METELLIKKGRKRSWNAGRGMGKKEKSRYIKHRYKLPK